MSDLEPVRFDSSGTPIYAHQVADEIDPAVQAKLDSWFSSELEGYDLADVKMLGRHVI